MMPPEDSVRAWPWSVLRHLFVVFRLLLPRQSYLLRLSTFHEGRRSGEAESNEIVSGANIRKRSLEKIFTFCRTNIKNTNDKNSGFTEEKSTN